MIGTREVVCSAELFELCLLMCPSPPCLPVTALMQFWDLYLVAPDRGLRQCLVEELRCLRSHGLLFIGTQFSNLYTAVDTPARGRVVSDLRRVRINQIVI
jgi:hypothetical protein